MSTIFSSDASSSSNDQSSPGALSSLNTAIQEGVVLYEKEGNSNSDNDYKTIIDKITEFLEGIPPQSPSSSQTGTPEVTRPEAVENPNNNNIDKIIEELIKGFEGKLLLISDIWKNLNR